MVFGERTFAQGCVKGGGRSCVGRGELQEDKCGGIKKGKNKRLKRKGSRKYKGSYLCGCHIYWCSVDFSWSPPMLLTGLYIGVIPFWALGFYGFFVSDLAIIITDVMFSKIQMKWVWGG